jgi:hypothetical protein
MTLLFHKLNRDSKIFDDIETTEPSAEDFSESRN